MPGATCSSQTGAVTDFLIRASKQTDYASIFSDICQMGVTNLQQATPVDTGETANSWFYQITKKKNGVELSWHNRNIEGGALVAVLIQYGHATKDGRHIPGTDYINPAMRPVFEAIDIRIKEVLL